MSRPPAEPPFQTTQWVVDATVLAHGGLTWEHEFSDTRFERLTDVAVSNKPAVAVELQFDTLDKRPVIHGELQGKVELICQRCLTSMQYPVHESFDLMLIDSEAELALVPESHEPWIANASRLDAFDLVEEQLLLALPLIAKHEDERECASNIAASSAMDDAVEQHAAEHASAEVQRPFGNLRDLLRKQ
ncbi:MAG: YceD family protein [Steroidobacteraceae bacterium]